MALGDEGRSWHAVVWGEGQELGWASAWSAVRAGPDPSPPPQQTIARRLRLQNCRRLLVPAGPDDGRFERLLLQLVSPAAARPGGLRCMLRHQAVGQGGGLL